jgi:hypothetical protein
LLRVFFVRTDVSEERIASIFKEGDRESGSDRNVRGRGGNKKVVRATLAAPRQGIKQVNRLGWWSTLIGFKEEPGWPWGAV